MSPARARSGWPMACSAGLPASANSSRTRRMNSSVKFSKTKHMTHATARAIACSIMLLILPSCAMPPLRMAEPPPCLPERIDEVNSPENSAMLTIEEFYQDPRLTCLIDQAVAGNRELKALNEDIAMASNEVLARSG